MLGTLRWLGAIAIVLTCHIPHALAQVDQIPIIDYIAFEQVVEAVESNAVVTKTPVIECLEGVPCAHTSARKDIYYVGITTVIEKHTDTVTLYRDTTFTKTITSTTTVIGHNCTVWFSTSETALLTSTLTDRTTLTVTKDRTVWEEVRVIETVYELCTSSGDALDFSRTSSTLPTNPSSPGTPTPGSFIPGRYIPGTYIPGTYIPGTAIPSTAAASTLSASTAPTSTEAPNTSTPSPSISMASDIPESTTLSEPSGSEVLVEQYLYDGAGKPSADATATLDSSRTAPFGVSRTGEPPVNKEGIVYHLLCAADGLFSAIILQGPTFDSRNATISDDLITFSKSIYFRRKDVELNEYPNLFYTGNHLGLTASPGALGGMLFFGQAASDEYMLHDLIIDLPEEYLPTPINYDVVVDFLLGIGDNRAEPKYRVVVPIQQSSAGGKFVTLTLENMNLAAGKSMAIRVSTSENQTLKFILRDLKFCQDEL